MLNKYAVIYGIFVYHLRMIRIHVDMLSSFHTFDRARHAFSASRIFDAHIIIVMVIMIIASKMRDVENE